MKKKEVDEDQMMKFDIQKATIGNKKQQKLSWPWVFHNW